MNTINVTWSTIISFDKWKLCTFQWLEEAWVCTVCVFDSCHSHFNTHRRRFRQYYPPIYIEIHILVLVKAFSNISTCFIILNTHVLMILMGSVTLTDKSCRHFGQTWKITDRKFLHYPVAVRILSPPLWFSPSCDVTAIPRMSTQESKQTVNLSFLVI